MSQKTIFVTGANGYVGNHVVTRLLDLGHKVYAADIKTDRVDERAVAVTGDLFSDGVEMYEKCGCPEICIHLAWRDGFVHSSDTHMEDLSRHYMLVKGMLNKGLKQILIMGSMHEIGYWEGAIDEDTPCHPLSLYGVAKDSLRRAIALLIQKPEYKDVVFQWPRGYYITGDDRMNHSIFAKILQAAGEGKETFPFTSGKNKYDFLDVKDLADMIAHVALQREVDGIINCCSGQPVSLGEKVEQFIAQNHLSIRLEYGAYPDRAYDSPGVWGNPDKMNRIMGLAGK